MVDGLAHTASLHADACVIGLSPQGTWVNGQFTTGTWTFTDGTVYTGESFRRLLTTLISQRDMVRLGPGYA